MSGAGKPEREGDATYGAVSRDWNGRATSTPDSNTGTRCLRWPDPARLEPPDPAERRGRLALNGSPARTRPAAGLADRHLLADAGQPRVVAIKLIVPML